MKKYIFLLTFAMFLAASLISANQAKAYLVYDYVGNPFTVKQGAYAGDKVTASVTFDIAEDYTGQINWSSKDKIISCAIETVNGSGNIIHQITGKEKISNVIIDFSFGQITTWLLSLYSIPIGILTESYNGTVIDYFSNPNPSPQQYDEVKNSAGTWSAVPLPGTLMLLGSGLLGLAGLGRRKLRKS